MTICRNWEKLKKDKSEDFPEIYLNQWRHLVYYDVQIWNLMFIFIGRDMKPSIIWEKIFPWSSRFSELNWQKKTFVVWLLIDSNVAIITFLLLPKTELINFSVLKLQIGALGGAITLIKFRKKFLLKFDLSFQKY